MRNKIMGMKDQVTIRKKARKGPFGAMGVLGKVHIEVRGPDGSLKDVRDVSNRVVDDGEEYLVDLWIAHETGAGLPTAMNGMKLGTDDGTILPIAATNQALGAYQTGSRVDPGPPVVGDFDVGYPQENGASFIQYRVTWDGAEVWTGIEEACISSSTADSSVENGDDGNRILARAIFAAINKAADDSIELTWNIELQSQA